MPSSSAPVRVVRFGVFEADFHSGELRKAGVRVKLHHQPFQVLAMLLDHPGELVTREEIRSRLWPCDTFVDFDHGLNNAVTRLREALGDSADTPRFVETLPRRGYRFIGTINRSAERRSVIEVAPVPVTTQEAGFPPETSKVRRSRYAPILLAVTVLGATFVGFSLHRLTARLFPQTRALKSIRSLAVLPLENLTGDATQEYLVDGVTDTLTTNLSKLGTLRVISHTSAMHYKGTHEALSEIARQLNVDAIIEGSVARSGNHIRVSAQLVDAANDQSLWVREYDRNLQDVLQLQNELATDVALEVAGKLSVRERKRLPHARPVNYEAYEAYLRGRYFMDQWSDQGIEKASQYFTQAIKLDPNEASAYAELANSYGMMVLRSSVAAAVGWRKAEAAATKAVELDDASPEAHSALANLKAYFHCDRSGAEKEFDRAFELNPSSGEVAAYHAFLLIQSGRLEEGIAEKKQSLLLDPLSPLANSELGMYLVIGGHKDEGIQQLQKAIEMEPNFSPAHARLAGAYREIGEYQRAVLELNKAIGLDPQTVRLDDLADVYLKWGKTKEARQVLLKLVEMSKHHYVSPDLIAAFYARLGEQEQALAWLEKATADDMPDLSRQEFNPLRSDPHFRKLAARFKDAKRCS